MHRIQLRPMTKRILRAAILASVIVIPLLILLPGSDAQSTQYLAADSLAVSPIHVLVFSGSEQCAYAELQANGASAVAPSNLDLRLVACQGKAAFSLVGDADVTERGSSGSGNSAPAVRAAYADVNSNAVYDQGDHLYLTTGSGQSLAATSSASSFTLRLTATPNRAAGTWAYASETDVVSYQSAAPSIAASWAWTDADRNGVLSSQDGVYVLPGFGAGRPAGSVLPSSAVALRIPIAPTATPSPSPGQTVTGGASLPVSPVSVLAFGSSSVTDDCAYAELHEVYAQVGPHPVDLRLVPCGVHNRWTLVGGSDSSETSYAGSSKSSPQVRLAYSDVNANAVFDGDDGLYLTTGVSNQMPGSSSPTSFTIRIRSPDANPGGAWALSSDSDIVSYGSNARSLAGSWAWVDQDKNGKLSEGDEVYLLPTTSPGYAAGSPLPSNSILIHAAAQSHQDCYDPERGFYDCNSPPPAQTPTAPTQPPTASPTPQPTNNTTAPQESNDPVSPYTVPTFGTMGTIAAATVAAGSATAFFRRRH
jgi:hypothetical protein